MFHVGVEIPVNFFEWFPLGGLIAWASMTGARKLLFICSRNQRRSVTAERLYRGFGGYEVLSAGTERGARTRVTQEYIEWADIIFVMEPQHLQRLRSQFKPALAGKRLICLQIPDSYGAMSLELMNVLRERLKLYIEVPD